MGLSFALPTRTIPTNLASPLPRTAAVHWALRTQAYGGRQPSQPQPQPQPLPVACAKPQPLPLSQPQPLSLPLSLPLSVPVS